MIQCDSINLENGHNTHLMLVFKHVLMYSSSRDFSDSNLSCIRWRAMLSVVCEGHG